MVHISQTSQVSEHVKTRSKKMWVRSVRPDLYIVKPKEKGKARRTVRILQSSAGIHIECTDKVTGKVCPANSYGMTCGHVMAVISRILINVKREANRKLKEHSQA